MNVVMFEAKLVNYRNYYSQSQYKILIAIDPSQKKIIHKKHFKMVH